MYILPGGGVLIKIYGVCRSNGSLFHTQKLNMGPIFNQNIPKQEYVFFLNFQQKNVEMGLTSRKIPQYDPYKWVEISRLERHTPVQTESGYPTRDILDINGHANRHCKYISFTEMAGRTSS